MEDLRWRIRCNLKETSQSGSSIPLQKRVNQLPCRCPFCRTWLSVRKVGPLIPSDPAIVAARRRARACLRLENWRLISSRSLDHDPPFPANRIISDEHSDPCQFPLFGTRNLLAFPRCVCKNHRPSNFSVGWDGWALMRNYCLWCSCQLMFGCAFPDTRKRGII